MLFRKIRVFSFYKPILGRGFAKNQKPDLNQTHQRIKRAQQIDFRSRMMEEEQLKRIRQSIQTTKENFNPVVQYIKLFRSKILSLILLGFFAFTAALIAQVGGVHQDPFTKKKKIILISDDFQKKLDENLRQTFSSHFRASENVSSRIKQQCRTMQNYIKSTTNRFYRVLLVSSQDKALIFLPSSIVISKNLLLTSKKEDLQMALLTMQALFVKKYHIKQLAFSNILHFLTHWLRPSNVSDVNMLKVYSRPYSQIQIEEGVLQASKRYNLSVDDIRTSITKIIAQELSASSIFSMKNRLQSIKKPQQK